MREIKFRAWDKEMSMMIYNGELLGHIEYDTNPLNVVNSILNYDDYGLEFLQYTGLKDKNGKEIYEGDIVEYEDEVNGVWAEYFGIPIIYSNEYAMFCFKDDEGNLLNIYRNLKVIGNIYEDKELLEG